MTQPTPSYTQDDLHRVVARDFSSEKVVEAMRVLGAYGQESWHHEVLRVQMACVKCSKGDLGRLAYWVGIAADDYRDILLEAEYPNYSAAKGAEAKQRAIVRDWEQLQQWLQK